MTGKAGKERDTARRGAGEEARSLISLISSLSKAGDAISADVVAARLGISHERALQLLYLLVTASATGEHDDDPGYLSLDYDDLDKVTLVFDEGIKGRPLRLNEAEAVALLQALDEAGLSHEAGLRAKLQESFSPSSRSADDVIRALSARPASPEEARIIARAAQAIADGRVLRFKYQKPDDGSPRQRAVRPHQAYASNERWYLEATDLSDGAVKRFRLDRMSDAELGEEAPAPPRKASSGGAGRDVMVRVTFHGREPLDLFWWDGLRPVSKEGDDLLADIPYYGGTWLVRHLAACGSSVTIHDPAVAGAVRAYARDLLLRQAAM